MFFLPDAEISAEIKTFSQEVVLIVVAWCA